MRKYIPLGLLRRFYLYIYFLIDIVMPNRYIQNMDKQIKKNLSNDFLRFVKQLPFKLTNKQPLIRCCYKYTNKNYTYPDYKALAVKDF